MSIYTLALESSCDETSASVLRMDELFYLMLFLAKCRFIENLVALCLKLHRVTI